MADTTHGLADAHAGPAERYVDPVIEAYKKDIDRSLIRYTLKLTPEQRLLNLQACLEDVVDMREAMKKAATTTNQ